MSVEQDKEYLPIPSTIQNLVAAFMRTIKTGRLYSSGHDLFKREAEKLHAQILETMGDRHFLFLGVAKDALFLEGNFYQGKDALFRSFVDFFHALGISHLLLKKDLFLRELESFIELLAGAKSGQGDGLLAALYQENIKHIGLGVLNYSVFSGVHAVAMQLFPSSDDPSIWRHLILQPAGLGSFSLDLEKVKAIARLSEDLEELKRTLHQFDEEMTRQVEGISLAQRGLLIGNFLQNLSSILTAMGAQKKQAFSKQVESALNSIDQSLKTQILGSLPPDLVGDDDTSVFQDIITAMPDQQLVYLLLDALEHSGSQSACFNHLFSRAIFRYKAARVLLDLIHQEMNRATRERRPGSLNQWQHLEQLVVRYQETEEFNAQYQKAIDDLATSLRIQQPMIEEEEMSRLGRTLDQEFLDLSKARLILDLLSHPHSPKQADLFVLPLLRAMGETVQGILGQQRTRLAGNLLRQILLSLNRFPKETLAREVINSWLRTDEVHSVLKSLMDKCQTYGSHETSALTAVCRLYPEKAGAYLVERFLSLDDPNSAQYQWMLNTLGSIAPYLATTLDHQFQKASDSSLPKLIDLVDLFMNEQMAPPLEDLLNHKDYAIRGLAVRTLGHIRSGKSVDRLGAILQERSWMMGKKLKSLQVEAARALAEIGSVEAKDILHRVASEGSGDLQSLCRELL